MRNSFPLFVLGAGGALAAMLLARRKSSTLQSPATPPPTGRWVFPVALFEGRRATVSDGFASKRTLRDGTVVPHLGVDLMFARRRPDELVSAYPPRTPNGSPHFFMPDDIGALVAADGTVAFAARTPQGCSVIVHHADRWATYYTHLATLDVRSGQVVRAGDRLGTIGFDPNDAERLKHLHLELWRGGTRTGAVDPEPYLASWKNVSPRNSGITYRPVGVSGEPYPEWLRALSGASGAYIIRERGGAIVYVGSSSAQRLYATITRHFQQVRHEAQEDPMT